MRYISLQHLNYYTCNQIMELLSAVAYRAILELCCRALLKLKFFLVPLLVSLLTNNFRVMSRRVYSLSLSSSQFLFTKILFSIKRLMPDNSLSSYVLKSPQLTIPFLISCLVFEASVFSSHHDRTMLFNQDN